MGIVKIQTDCGIMEIFKIVLYRVMADFTQSLNC